MFRRKRKPSDFGAEIEAHIQHESERLREQGLSEEEARAAARRSFGNVMQAEERFYEFGRWLWWDYLRQDFRFGLRMLARNPGFTVTVVLTLALSIGANTAIFSIVNTLLLKSLPYAHPERMGTIYTRVTGPLGSDERHHVNGEQWELLRDNVPALISAVSGLRASGANLEAGSQVQYVHAGRISAHYLDVLAIHPIMGRNFSDAEDLPHGPKTTILSYGLWRNALGANPTIPGQTVLLKGEPYTVIGVLPEGAIIPLNADLYTALQPSRQGEGTGTNFEVITRLRDGVIWQEADAEINRAWSLRTQRYELENNPGAQVTYYSVPLQKGETATLRPQVLTLMLAAGFILLIACANLAGLTLVRVMRRTSEVATRLALGASRWQIRRQFWIENLLLALVGGAVSIGVGYLALRGLLLLLPEHFLHVAQVSLDGRVMGSTLAASLLASILFGMLPAIASGSVDLRSSMASRAVAGSGGLRLRQGLIAGEVALTVVLLAASGLLIRTLVHLETLPPGFNPNGVMTAKASLDEVRFHDAAAFRKLLAESTTAMQQIPGVQQSAVGLSLPYERTVITGDIAISDGKEAGQKATADVIYTTPDYFAALQIPVLAGRSFTEADGPDTQRVAIVNQKFARKFFHGANAVGHYVDKDTMIVGVVENVAMAPGIDPVAPLTSEETMYLPAAQMEARQLGLLHVWFQPSWIVRTSGPVEGLTGQMQRALASADPNLPFSGFFNMRDLLAKTLAIQRVEVALLSAMTALALLLSAVGIFALIANIVTQKTREIGIRLALGSSIRKAMIDIGRAGVGASALGLVLGLVLCSGALRAMRSVLYGVEVYDVPTILAVVLMLSVVTLLATTVPALRVARIDPAKTLREE
ncbi:MAG: ABC transporter permease [Acidobacteria bacterium]|nr:MAG: ABC transporter permease [Acidobacteriota bacterium]